MAEIHVAYYLNAAGTQWIARGRPSITAPTGTSSSSQMRFNDPGSTFNGSKVFS